jgi:amino acid adenylation domain-containing protein
MLSYGERALWFIQQLAPDSAAYNVASAVRISAAVDRLALRDALQILVDRHAALRSTFELDGATPVRHVQSRCTLPFDHVDARGWTDQQLSEALAARTAEVFDLAHGPLLRTVLFARGEAEHVLLLASHHIAMDSWSCFAVIVPELRAIYAAIVEGRLPSEVCPSPASYADYVAWQAGRLDSAEGARQRAYWHAQLAGDLPRLNLRSDRPRPSRRSPVGATLEFSLDPGLVRRLKHLARQDRTTLSTLLLGAFQVLLQRYSDQDELLIGAPLSGRTERRFKHTVGYFVSPVALRTCLADNPTFSAIVARTHQTMRGALDNQDYPLARLVEELQPVRDASRSPLFEVMFNYMGELRVTQPEAAELLPMSVVRVPQQEGQFDLVLEFADDGHALVGELRYSTDLFEQHTIEHMAALYQSILCAAAGRPRATLAELPELSIGERSRLRIWPDRPDAGAMDRANTGAPLSQVEAILCGVFADVLGIGQVGPGDDFFALGGYSLQATQVVARISIAFGVDLPVRSLFEAPTVRQLASIIDRRLGELAQPPLAESIERLDRSAPLELSFSQQRMWFVQAMCPESSAYNVVLGTRLAGTLDADVLQRAVDVLVRRHEALRTSVRVTPAGPLQAIATDVTVSLPLIDLTSLPADEIEAAARERASAFAAAPFNLSEPPLFRLALIRLAADLHVLVLVLHHVISDAWSIGVLGSELAGAYQALLEHRAPALAELPIQYADFARWQREWLRGDVLQDQLQYWREQLEGLSPLRLPTDRPRPSESAYRGAHVAFDFPRPLLEALRTWSQHENATPFMAFLSAFATLLHRYTGQSDIAVGVPIANRRWLHSERLIGPLNNMLVVRTDFSQEPSSTQLLRQVRGLALDAYSHQDIPFDVLVAELQPDRAANQSPLIQVMFDYINTPIGELHFPQLSWTAEHVDRRGSQFDLALIVIDTPQIQRVSVEFDTDLFDEATIERLVEHLRTLLQSMLVDPEQSVATLPLLPEQERQRMLYEWNATQASYPRESSLCDLVGVHAQRTPRRPAVIAGDDELTCAELEERSNRLAHYLLQRGISRGSVVAVDLERTALLPVALLAVWKAGAAYVPIDPAAPHERRRFILEDSQAVAVVTQSALGLQLGDSGLSLICLDAAEERAAIDACPPTRLSTRGEPDDAAYVIYTSGSTGRPKGVQIGHRGVTNFLHAMRQQPGLTPDETLVAVTTLSFDIAVLELFLPLLVGARLVIASRDVVVDGARLARLLETSQATVMQATPVTWRLLLEAGWSPARGFTAICGGEPLPPDLAADLLGRGVTVWNAYGPTETTVWSTLEHVTRAADRIPVGRPIANTRVYVLDAHLQPVPIGVWGELYIAGDGVAHGYLRRPELTAMRFVAESSGAPAAARMYRTGDIARFLADGRLDVLGRTDHQVKIRGHRVELGEIEAILRQHPSVREACLVLRETPSEEARLLAYVTPQHVGSADSQELRGFLRHYVPEFMLPSAFVQLDSLPRTTNGKLDRAALPEPPAVVRVVSGAGPRDEIERSLVAEWEDLLERSPIGIHDNFFDLGGHSLLAIRLVYRLRDRFGWHVPLATFLRSATVAELADLVRAPTDRGGWRSLVEIQTAPGSTPLFVVHGLFGDLLSFAEVIAALGPEQTVFGLRARGLDGLETPLASVADMAKAYVEEMRSVQPHGPYRLLGWSAGGSIAYEMACQLRAAGESVGLLAILDHPPAGGAAADGPPLPVRIGRIAAHALRNMPYWVDVLRRADLVEKRSLLSDRLRATWRALGRMTGQRTGIETLVQEIEATYGLEYVQEWPEFRRRVLQAQVEGMTHYRPRPYPGQMLLFRCRRQPLLSAHDPLLGWGPYAQGGVEVIEVPGTHRALLRDAAAQLLGRLLSQRLKAPCDAVGNN